jgi:hypothetical protein
MTTATTLSEWIVILAEAALWFVFTCLEVVFSVMIPLALFQSPHIINRTIHVNGEPKDDGKNVNDSRE